ncbi:Diacylglycerol pyrophosphate phosphatase 1 Short=DGPP phosphatase; AltName: Full=Phosphatidate phosphatase [Serendipita indica DSM 11827]|uniref:Related to DPP1-diacylglycerol pyrophosphate phosphatase n=1 Tax=Serendipita indica (strain DSM 11827) TaxID=1109443 RepID=G4T5K0_SERID|nr:Diacylglycerol pyrophosphate phosphatase 1 Short=DGPP phosphatase; AltName: Full=Phosphatidate phosphatase [Serendipita indica DSM 11827]CCA66548.1 related to DPP1-diacylglycerol pyrophosphate phosphatase [Serendipita indica DSM 11827]
MLKGKPSGTLQRVWEFVKTFSDWILLGVGEALAQFLGDRMPYAQLFSVLDPTISFPKAEHEKVPAFMLYVYAFAVPIAVLLVVNLAFGPGNLVRRAKLLNWSVLCLGTSVIFAQLFTEFVKFIIGRPRPDFLSRCQPDAARAQAAFTATAVTLFSSTICTTTNTKALNDGFRSFPSGHSSMSFAGLTFLSLFLAGRFRLFAAHTVHGKHLWAYAICAAPLLLASFVTSSRVSDFRHRGTDVLAGASLGVFFAILAYRYYFPWLGSPLAGTPWMVLREEGEQGIEGYKTRSRSGSNGGAPLLPTTAQQSYREAATPYTQTGDHMELQPVPTINVHEASYPPPNH